MIFSQQGGHDSYIHTLTKIKKRRQGCVTCLLCFFPEVRSDSADAGHDAINIETCKKKRKEKKEEKRALLW